MTTRDFCIRVAPKLGTDWCTARTLFRKIMEEAVTVIVEGDEFRLPGIGKVFLTKRKARTVYKDENGKIRTRPDDEKPKIPTPKFEPVHEQVAYRAYPAFRKFVEEHAEW